MERRQDVDLVSRDGPSGLGDGEYANPVAVHGNGVVQALSEVAGNQRPQLVAAENGSTLNLGAHRRIEHLPSKSDSAGVSRTGVKSTGSECVRPRVTDP